MTTYRAAFWYDEHTDPNSPGWVLRVTRDGETIHEDEPRYTLDDMPLDEVRDAIERELIEVHGPVNPRRVHDDRPGVEAFEWSDPLICFACDQPIPDDERVVVTYGGDGEQPETWHRACAAAEQPEA